MARRVLDTNILINHWGTAAAGIKLRKVNEVKLAKAYLAEFRIADEGEVTAEDWREARRFAEWVARDGKRRQMGDCLIRAICNRLHLEVFTAEKRFPH